MASKLIEMTGSWTARIGYLAAWCCLAMAVLQVSLVLGRAYLQIGSVRLQETIIYLNVVMIGIGLAYTMMRDAHTRVDVFRERMSERAKAIVDILGLVCFALPVVVTVVWASFPYVVQAWITLEGSRNVGGLGGTFIIKSMLLVFPCLLAFQGAGVFLRALRTLQAERGSGDV